MFGEEHAMDKKTLHLRAAQILIYLNALVWVIVGVAALIRSPEASAPLSAWLLVVGLGAIAYGALLAAAGVYLRRGRKAYTLALGLIILSIILVFFDDVGWADLLGLVPALIAAVFLLVERKTLLGQAAAA
jgi:lysylphosphatidylglycerol synthetase-like protein (DUF2156 family)